MTDFPIGQDKLLYSTAEVFTYAVMDEKPTLVLWVHPDESGEVCFTGSHQGKLQTCDGCSDVQFNVTEHGTILKFTQGPGLSVAFVGDTRVIIVDRSGAYAMFAPTLTIDPLTPVNETVLVHGPSLVRGAQIVSDVIAITGDTVEDAQLEVFAPSNVNKATWNGKPVDTKPTPHGSLIGRISGPLKIELPSLGPWKVQDSLPEVLVDYSDDGVA